MSSLFIVELRHVVRKKLLEGKHCFMGVMSLDVNDGVVVSRSKCSSGSISRGVGGDRAESGRIVSRASKRGGGATREVKVTVEL